MIDIKLIRENPEHYKQGMVKKQHNPEIIDKILDLDKRRRETIQKIEEIKSEKNKASEIIASLKGTEKESAIKKMQEIGLKEKELQPILNTIEEEFNDLLSRVPNPP